MRLRLAIPLCVAVVATLALASTASARTAPCLGGFAGSKCLVWNARVVAVDDGDTITARVAGAGVQKLRLNGVQAMELWNYKPNHRAGYCHALEARNLLNRLIAGSHRRVRLYAQHKNSRSVGEGRSRFRRTIGVKSHGRWIDAGAEVIKRGLGLWLPNGDEWAWNGPYSKFAQQAQRRGKNLWNPKACGAGPSQSSPLRMKLKWDAANNDAKNQNGEWVRITNLGRRKVSLRGWWLRDSYLRGKLHGRKKGRGFQFPKNASIAPNRSVTIYAGKGGQSKTKFHWGLGDSPFENATGDRKRIGDGAYLFDPRGNVRAYRQYPCRSGGCSDALAGKVGVTANARGVEFVTIRNTSSQAISLWEYEIESVPWFYEFDRSTVLQPRDVLILNIGRTGIRRGTIVRNWGFDTGLLGDGKDVVTLRNPQGAPVACDAWGGLHCPGV
jgi:endonuclease YncB( thermonuclease family)